ncbi:MAG: membrane lipoprotein lipid attachment site-containing protein [Alphaproteobacteria bacterium]|nr:membrane lipoprotein lipid attachment site-containing protein [Alphaproteobacteria bacterium]
MKKVFALFAVLVLAACSGLVKNENGSQYLVQLDAEPIGCTYLYKLESEVSVYDVDDARRYLENRIVDQARPGNAYWITSQRTKPNEWVIFGPERSFVLVANVYDCPHPNKVRTAKDGGSQTVSVPVVASGCAYGSCY